MATLGEFYQRTAAKADSQNKKRRRKKGKQRSCKNRYTYASLLTEDKIERYFGQILSNPSFSKMKSSLPGTTTEDILNNFITEVKLSNMPFSVKTADEMEKVLQTADDSFVFGTNQSVLLKKVFEEILKDIGNEENVSRKEWFKQLKQICVGRMSRKYVHNKGISDMLDALSSVGSEGIELDVLHAIWRKFWENFVWCCVTGHSKDTFIPYVKKHGECVGSLTICPTKIETTSDSESSVIDEPPVTISVKPDFIVRGRKFADQKPMKECNLLIAEIKTTSCDGDTNPLVESDLTSHPGAKRKQKHERSCPDEPQKKKLMFENRASLTCSSDDASRHSDMPTSTCIKDALDQSEDTQTSSTSKQVHISVQRHCLGQVKSQHFLELLGMLRTGNKANYFFNSWRIFGLYCVMNRAYITHLMPDVLADDDNITAKYDFMMLHSSRDYHESNMSENCKRFKMGTFGYFNIFELSHVDALIKILKFIVWYEYKDTLMP